MSDNLTEIDEAAEALNDSDSYVNKKAAESIASSLVTDFQMLMNLAFWQALLAKHEDAENFVNTIRSNWEERSSTFLKSEARRFQDVILKSSSTEGKKLPDDIQNIFTDYSRTLTTAFGVASNAVDEIIQMLLQQNPTSKKENENER